MTIEEMKESIIKLAEHLLKIGECLETNNKMLDSVGKNMSPRGMVWFLMIGACYSLLKALPLLDKSRNPQDQIDAAKNLLKQIQQAFKEKKETLFNEDVCGSWVVGYYLYSTEQRISSALHRLLKTYQKEDKKAFELTKKILKQCPICKKPSSNTCLPLSRSILKKFNFQNYSALRKNRAQFYADKSMGGCLNRVWFRVNDIKHCQFEETNPEDPIMRWQDAHSALNGVIQIFEDFAAHRGYYT